MRNGRAWQLPWTAGPSALERIFQQLTPEQRTQFATEDEELKKEEHDARLEGVQIIPHSDIKDDSTNDDYIHAPPMPSMSPRAHDVEAGGSGSARSMIEAPEAQPTPASQSELSQQTTTVHLLAESLMATQARARAARVACRRDISVCYGAIASPGREVSVPNAVPLPGDMNSASTVPFACRSTSWDAYSSSSTAFLSCTGSVRTTSAYSVQSDAPHGSV